jgi:hypothetical protein
VERPDPAEVIKHLDWERWRGAQPKIDFNDRHIWHWRCSNAYGTGRAGDLLSHAMDHVQTVRGWRIPGPWMAAYRFEKQNCLVTFEGSINSRRIQPPECLGREGRILFNGIGQEANRSRVFPDGPAYAQLGKAPPPVYEHDRAKGAKWPSHLDYFLQCVRSGGRPRCHIDDAFIESAT